jgi:hypothetical protein
MNNYLQQIQIRGGNNDLEEYNVGGIPITSIEYLTNTSQSQGGGIINDSISKISHLSIPLGLVLIPQSYNNCNRIHKNPESEFLEESLFDNLWKSTVKQSTIDKKKMFHTRKSLKILKINKKTRKTK